MMCLQAIAMNLLAATYCLVFLIIGSTAQSYYYDEEFRPYYSDLQPPGEMFYQPLPIDHSEDVSMRALAGLAGNGGVTSAHLFSSSEADAKDTVQHYRESGITEDVRPVSTEALPKEDSTVRYHADMLQNNLISTQSPRDIRPREDLPPNSQDKDVQLDSVREHPPKLNRSENTITTHSRFDSFQGNAIITANPAPGVNDEVLLNQTLQEPPYKNEFLPGFYDNSTVDVGNPFMHGNFSLFDGTLENGSDCDANTHFGCDVIHYERCNVETKQCYCLNGYIRQNAATGTGPCTAVSFYHGHVTVGTSGSGQSYSSQQLQAIKQKLLTLIQLTFKKHGIGGVLDLDIRSVEKDGQDVSLTFELGMDRELIISRPESFEDILSQELIVTSTGDLLLDAETSQINGSSSLFSSLIEVNPCVDKDHNPCGEFAACHYKDHRVTCQCRPGYEDLSPNSYRLPGEICVEKCKCMNGGLCLDDDVLAGTKQCSCLNWYFGSECQVDGKELLLICCCSIGSLILLGLLMCCCYYGCAKHRNNSARSRMFPFTPDVNILKLPRVWMDTASYHDNELSPPNVRRLSIASERNPYFDGYIMEDLPPLSTLPRHGLGDNHSTYYQPSLAHCPATMSSHSFYRY